MKRTTCILLTLLLAVSCGQKKSAPVESKYRQFPAVELPGVIAGTSDAADYLAEHWWDGFFDGTGPTDTSAVIGVRNEEVEGALSSFITVLDRLPISKAQEKVEHFFSQIETAHTADTSKHIYPLITEMVSRYLYDPNSPLRNEDYYLPFAKRLESSPYTPDNLRGGYAFEARMCSINPTGSIAPDFSFKDAKGRVRTLHSVKAGRTLLFFSNPGCHSCKDIMDVLTSRPYLDSLIKDGDLAIVNIYIDNEIDKWKEYEPNYPRSWVTGYDYKGIIRGEDLYDVRAIPSLYLLDKDKKILMKDAPTQKVMDSLDRMNNKQ